MSKRDKEFSAAYAAVAEKFNNPAMIRRVHMTRKDYELIAATINSQRGKVKPEHAEIEKAILDRLTLRFSDTLSETNSAFKRQTFLSAAGFYDPNKMEY